MFVPNSPIPPLNFCFPPPSPPSANVGTGVGSVRRRAGNGKEDFVCAAHLNAEGKKGRAKEKNA